ncbi:serine protease [Clavibacter sp. VKM Ac-2873]|uniref:trypsin-like serine peptidase n=1 Tax=Clavibacter sp. VKM Ac-2873 TaxID=2783813 RepID=UPI00188A742A|nr:serine protease [Clavibacter sp. VKM Ac-2873]MBF4617560.1 serine protease [Clavibacter sp. VKM Ac-2873]
MRIRPRSIPASPSPSAAGRSRHAYAALALVGGLAAAGLAVPSAASAADASTGASVVVPASVDQAAAAAHWTPAARAEALAADASTAAGPASASRSAILSTSADATATAGAPVPHPDQPFVGVLFYVAGGRDHACTASVVDTPTGDTIATAAHCLADRRTGAATTLATFIPGAQGATAPHGIWPVRVAAVSSAWTASGRASDDAGFARVSGPAGEVLAASVGAAEPVFGTPLVPATGQAPSLAILGYPTAGSATAALEACEGRPQHAAGGETSLPCALGKGAAGAPVLTFTGEQHAVVSRTSAGHGVLLAAWGAEAQRAFASLQGR